MYTVPNEYYFRLHHVRPRFKNEVESVLGYVAFSIAQIGRAQTPIFKSELCKSIRMYGANATAKQKTIDNWRTEIGALFGMYIELPSGYTVPTQHSIDLANTSNLQTFFTGFVYSFQYPGGHVKPKAIQELLDEGISFHPYRWLFNALLQTNLNTIDRCEFCHCVLNDMRVTRDHEPIENTVSRIVANRQAHETYNSEGDVVRYAMDLLDYAVLAGLLIERNGLYSLNAHNKDVALMIASSNNHFDKYDGRNIVSLASIGGLEHDWFAYVERCYQDSKTKVEEIVAERIAQRPLPSPQNATSTNNTTPQNLAPTTIQPPLPFAESQPTSCAPQAECSNGNIVDESEIASIDEDDTARIGDYGENMIFQHECLRVKGEGRSDLVHLIKRIPTHYAVGYDVKSIETDTEYDRFIEVKTTKSKKPLMFKQIHLTTNEWRTAQSSGNKYCVYRLMISEEGSKLFVIRDPVQKFRDNLITIIPRDGMDITFTDASGEEVDLLCVH